MELKKKNSTLSKKSKKDFSNPQMVALGFLVVITIGTILLSLPISSRTKESSSILNSLFTATSATCVTGLVVHDTYLHWSKFGQAVIITLIQIGGLGFMTVITMFSIVLKRKIGLKERSLLQESVNTMHIGGIVRLIKKVVLGTFLIEFLGAIFLSIRFIPKMGIKSGIFNSIFFSISAFCNAGFDLSGKYGEYSSLITFYDDVIINITIMLLIIIGGIGFFVWDDIINHKFKYYKYRLHTKIVLSATAILILIPSILFYFLEIDNTIKDMSPINQMIASAFSAVTPRTAGFNTVDTAQLTPGSKFLTMILMFIGGSPGSTAGGIKTTTFVVIILSAWSSLRNTNDCNIYKRRLENDTLKKASTIVCVNSTLIICSILIITNSQPYLDLTDIVFEVLSAIDTVGMSTGITRDLNEISKLVIITLMYCGRVGSVSFALLFTENKACSAIQCPVEKINIG